MRRVAVVVTMLSTSALACGGFLGFGDDDEPTPSGDGGGVDVSTADGGTTSDADAAPSEICAKRTLVLGTDAGPGGPDWSPGVTTVKGGASLSTDGGVLVSHSGDGDAGTTAEATLFTTRSGNATRVRCNLRVASSSFSDKGRLFQIRVEGPKWTGFYDVRVDWSSGIFRMAYQADTVDGGFSAFPQVPAPAENTMHDLDFELVLGATPKFTMTLVGQTYEMAPPPPETITRTQMVIGTFANPPFVPHEVRYQSVDCEMCISP